MKSVLDQTLEKNKQKYIDRLLKLVSIDTHDIGHGIEGGLEAEGRNILRKFFGILERKRLYAIPSKKKV